MIQWEKGKQIFDKIKLIYIFCFVIYLLASRIAAFVLLIGVRSNELMYMAFAVGGAIVLLGELLFHVKEYGRLEYILLGVMIAACAISTVWNRTYGIGDNVKTLVWLCIQVFLLASLFRDVFSNKEKYRSYLKYLMNTAILVWTVAVVVSLGQFLMLSRYLVFNPAERQGFYDGRLFGIFRGPNSAAICCLICIILMLFFIKWTEKKWIHGFYIAAIVCHGLYIILSESRTTLIAAAIAIPLATYFIIREKRIQQGKSVFVISFAISGILAAGIVLAMILLPNPLKGVAQYTSQARTVFGLCEFDNHTEMKRVDTEEDVSNGRTDIWKDVAMVAKENIVIGVAPRNLLSYVHAKHPGCYIDRRQYQAHNMFLALLAGTGLIGFLPFIILVIWQLILVIRYAWNHRGKSISDEFVISLAIVGIMLISGCLMIEIFFVNTANAALFWLFLGMLFAVTSKFNKERKNRLS